MIGKDIFNYEIESLIGEGGTGQVYLAYDKLFGVKVAIKHILPNLIENYNFKKKLFHTNAKKSLSLKHPNIVHNINYVFRVDSCIVLYF